MRIVQYTQGMPIQVMPDMYIFCGFKDYRSYWVALDDQNQLLGVLSYSPSSYRPGTIAHTFTEVHSSHYHKGIASALWHAFLAQMKAEGQSVSNTPYESLGEQYLKPLITRLSQEYQVTVIERQ